MTEGALIATHMDPVVKARASQALAMMGLSLSDAIRLLLTHIVEKGSLPAGLAVDLETYDAWVQAKVHEALDDPRPDIPHEEVETRAAVWRAETRRRLTEGKD